MCSECGGRDELVETDHPVERPWCMDCHHWIRDAPSPPPREVHEGPRRPSIPDTHWALRSSWGLPGERTTWVTGGCDCPCKGSSVVFRIPT